MARYIDAELALKLKDENGNWVYDLYDLEAYLMGVPTADVQEVKHGKWIDDDDEGYEEEIVCSICNEECPYISHFEEEYDYDWEENLVSCGYYNETKEYLRPPYCMHCGAKMDGGDTV